MPNLTLRTLMAATIVMLAASCAQPNKPKRPMLAPGDNIQERHWVHSTKLRSVMAKIEQKTTATWPQEVEKEYAVRDRTAVDIALNDAMELATELAKAAAFIPESIVPVKMSEADRRGFNAQAATLVDQSYRLRDAALNRDIERMRRELSFIRATCRSCHERYRDVSGPMSDAKNETYPDVLVH